MKTIVIADDDKGCLFGLAEMLSMTDGQYRVYTAESGDEADGIIQTMHVDLLITDLRMPGLVDGLELALRAAKRHPGLPVIVISSCADAHTVRALGAHNRFFLDKPLNVNELLDTMRQALS